MRRRNRGRGGHRGGRGGSGTSRNGTSAAPAPVAASENNYTAPTITFKTTTTPSSIHQRQSSPYARHLRGTGKSIKSAINSILYDKDNQEPITNGIVIPLVAAGIALRTNGISKEALLGDNFYLHKKFKKPTVTVTGTADPDVAPISISNGTNGTKEDVSIDILNNNKLRNKGAPVPGSAPTSSSSTSTTTVYKPKFRAIPHEDTHSNQLPEPGVPTLPKTINTTNETNCSPSPLIISPTATRQTSEPLPRNTLKRLDIQSLDDRISQIIDQNQSILATWPEHLTKRPKGSGGRASFSSKNGYHPLTIGTNSSGLPIVFERNSPSRGRSSGFDLSSASASSSPGSSVSFSSDLSRLSNKSHLVRSNSDASSYVSNALRHDSSTGLVEVVTNSVEPEPSSFMIPKKKRRLSPLPGILSGGEVSELPKSLANPPESRQGRSFSFSQAQEVDMTVRVSNCGNSGANVIVRNNPVQQSTGRLTPRFPNPTEESSNSSFNSLDLDKNPPIRIRKTSIFEIDSSNSSSPAQFTPIPKTTSVSTSPKRRGRPPRKSKEEQLHQSSFSCSTDSSNSSLIVTTPKVSPTMKTMPGLVLSAPVSAQVPLQEVMVQIKPDDDALTKPPSSSNLLIQTSSLNPKRPTFLALKPMNSSPKKKEVHGIGGGGGGVLPSPETPRGAKNYNQMFINGHAYTYLGFKISTRSSYTCLFKPQPMFIPMETDPKLSMYSNWQPRPRDPKAPELSISTNDSRVNLRKSLDYLYTISKGKNFDVITSPSPSKQSAVLSPLGKDRLLIPASCSPGPPIPNLGPVNLLGAQTEPISPATPPPNFGEDCITGMDIDGPIRDLKPIAGVPFSAISSKLIGIEQLSSTDLKKAQERCNVKNALLTPATTSSSNSSSSGSECLSSPEDPYKNNFPKGRSISLSIDTSTSQIPPSDELDKKDKDRPRSQSVSLSSPSGPRVRIMEGGFESNEDYTYVRGRGRGRYVCEACGIRCKKPSMLRKHLKTHTDLRPYTCKLCNFSFKTKGNLTKHQKSKSHHKKCIGLGIHPDSSQSLEMTGPALSDDSDEEDDDDEDNETDSNDEQCEDEEGSLKPSLRVQVDEKEIALSLLDLSQTNRIVQAAPTEIELKPAPSVANKKDPFEDIPIDLSVKLNATAPVPAKLNGSMEVVAEALRWEGEEESFVRNGCLNLKKIPNDNGTEEKVEVTSTPDATTTVKAEPLPTDQEPLHIDRPSSQDSFEYEIKRRRRLSSTSSLDKNSFNNNNTTTTSDPITFSLPSKSASHLSPEPQPPEPKTIQKKLHQPWLSTVASSPEVPERALPVPTTSSMASPPKVDSPTPTGLVVNGTHVLVKDEVESNDSWNGGPGTEPGRSPTKPQSFNGLLGLKPQAEFRQPSGAQALVKDEGKAECNVCGKTFSRASQLTLHMNIHYLERPFRCDPCGVSFRTKGHLIKHRRSSSHDCKVYLTEAWGVANEENPRPFKCVDCKIAFRIHGHLAKHLRSKMHIMRMECLGKLPFGIYFEMEKSGLNLNEIDTTDCDMSLVSLQSVARKIYGESWREKLTQPIEEPA